MEYLTPLTKYATPEVMVVLAALVATWIGWKACAKGCGLLGSIAAKAGYLGLAAALLFICGIGGTGLGLGELVCRWTNTTSPTKEKGMDDATLTALADKCHDKEMATLILDYAKNRDGQNKNEDLGILTRLVEKQMDDKSSTKDDRDANSKTLVTFMEYLKSREGKSKNGSATPVAYRDALALNDVPNETSHTSLGELSSFLIGGKPSDQPVAQVDPKSNKDSLFSIPFSMCLLGLGIGSTLSGICCHRLRKKSATTTV